MNHPFIRFIILIVLLFGDKATAQIFLKSEYLASSRFLNEEGNRIGEGKGALTTLSGGFQLPVSIKLDTLNRPTAWALAVKGIYARMNNLDLSADYCLDKLFNAQLAVVHTRPLSERWSIIAMLGGGLYSDLSGFSGKSLLGQGGVLVVRKMNSNLDLGGGAAINNVLGYPMAFVSFYLDWHKDGLLDFNLSLTNTFEVSMGLQVNKQLKLRLAGEANGLSAIVTKDGESTIFVQQYSTLGLQPEYKLGTQMTLRLTAGVAVSREVYYQDRSIRSFYGDTPDEYPHFALAPYVALAIKYGI